MADERGPESSAEEFARRSVEASKAGNGLPESLAKSLRSSSRPAPDRPHAVTLESVGGLTVYVGAEGFAWWLTVWDSARAAAGVCEELPAAAGESLPERRDDAAPDPGRSRRRWWRRS